jgi:hypothetical protein
MPWNDAPPSPDELKSPAKTSWTDLPPQPDELKPEWSDIPHNIMEGIKETPQTIAGIVKAPYQIGQALGETAKGLQTGQAIGETPVGQMGKSLAAGAGRFMEHPWQSTKETIIEHPIGTAATVAPLIGPAGRLMGMGKAAEGIGAAGEAAGAAGKAGEASAGVAGAAKVVDPLSAVKDFVTSKYGQAAAKPKWNETVAKYLQEEARNLGAKDLGLQPRQIQSMGPGFKGVEKAEALIDYGFEKGYFDPKLGPIGRKEAIVSNMNKAGHQVEALRTIADTRGAPPVPEIANQVQQMLQSKYGYGTNKAPAQVQNVMEHFQHVDPTHKGLADLATTLNESITDVKKMGQHPGPATDAANLISKMNNDSIRGVLNPQESELYTNSLRDFGAHKKLEQAVSASMRRGMGARSNQRGILGRAFQEALDRGVYRLGSNVAQRTAKSVLKNPQATRTLPDFFEEFAHQSGDVLDESLGLSGE